MLFINYIATQYHELFLQCMSYLLIYFLLMTGHGQPFYDSDLPFICSLIKDIKKLAGFIYFTEKTTFNVSSLYLETLYKKKPTNYIWRL